MSAERRPGRQIPRRRDTLLAYAALAVILVLSVLGFVLWQNTSLLLVGVLLGGAESSAVIQDLSVALVGIGLFVLLVVAEPNLRRGARQGDLRRRFLRLAIPLVAFIVLEMLVQEAIFRFG
jgi:hypothetical protein